MTKLYVLGGQLPDGFKLTGAMQIQEVHLSVMNDQHMKMGLRLATIYKDGGIVNGKVSYDKVGPYIRTYNEAGVLTQLTHRWGNANQIHVGNRYA